MHKKSSSLDIRTRPKAELFIFLRNFSGGGGDNRWNNDSRVVQWHSKGTVYYK